MTTSFAPLDGVLVIDLSRALAGPHAAMLLGDLGARVIKVEAPGTGDDTRAWGPPFAQPDAGTRESTYFLSCNRNKESISLDLKAEADEATLAELNPRLVTLSISGFGHDGPEGGRAGYDQIAQGEAGLMSLTGPDPDHPQRVGVPSGDLTAGIYGAYGVLAALRERDRTGAGQVVRTSLLAALVGLHAFQGTAWTVAGETESGLDRDTVLARLTKAGVPAGRIRGTDEVYEWEQTRSQRLTVDVEHASLGPLTLPGMALRTFGLSSAGELSESTRREHDAPPLLNADGPAILSWLR
jgi:crotonobetainyl-CoA:carnitine CoA-transferase CaiB-like acyl-CoA transferase